MYLTPIIEFSEDDLTDSTPTWQDVTNVLLEAEWSAGIQTEGDDPSPGSARFRFHDNTRQFEPDFAAGSFYPNVVPDRRFRLRITSSAVTYNEGIWYSQVFEPSWPDGATGQQAQVSCGDGMTVLALDDLPGLDPPEAESYEDVVAFYDPWGYWRLGDPEGTRAVANIKVKFRGHGKKRRKIKRRRGNRYLTREEAGGVAGASGIYKGLPALGERSFILGDTDTSVLFDGVNDYVRVPVEAEDLIDSNRVSACAWVTPQSVHASNGGGIVSGPFGTGAAESVWSLMLVDDAGNLGLQGVLCFTSGSTLVVSSVDVGEFVTLDQLLFAAMTWNGNTLRVFMDGVLVASGTASGLLRGGSAGNDLLIGARTFGGASTVTGFFDGWIDEVAVYERGLTQAQIANLYTSGAERGLAQNPAGVRIDDLAASTLWAAVDYDLGGREVAPVMMHGQPRMDEIAETAHAEGPRTMFFFDGTGDPVYLGHEFQTYDAAYRTVQATFGNATGEVPYENVTLVSDDDTYNTVVASHESGDAVEVSTGAVPARVNTEWTDVTLVDHEHVESLANHVLSFYEEAQFRPAQLELSGVDSSARLQILSREIGDLIRIKHRPRGAGAIIDRVCNIIGYEKRLDGETGHLTCTWSLGRGFNAGAGVWRAGITGFSEAGSTTVAG